MRTVGIEGDSVLSVSAFNTDLPEASSGVVTGEIEATHESAPPDDPLAIGVNNGSGSAVDVPSGGEVDGRRPPHQWGPAALQ